MAFRLLRLTGFKESGQAAGMGKTGDHPAVMAKSLHYIPLFGRLSVDRQLQVVGSALVGLILITAIATYIDKITIDHDETYVSEAGILLTLSQRLAKNAQLSLSGDTVAFDYLTDSWESFDSILTLLENGDANLPATKEGARMVLEAMRGRTRDIRSSIANLRASRSGLEGLARSFASINGSTGDLGDLMHQLDAAGQHERAMRLSLLLERITGEASTFISGSAGGGKAEDVETIKKDSAETEALLNTFSADDPLAEKIKDLSHEYLVLAKTVIDNEKVFQDALQGVSFIVKNSDMLRDFSHKLVAAYLANKHWSVKVMTASGALALLLLLLVVKIYLDDTRRRAQQAELDNRVIQQSILRLKNELSTLAEGDLTIKATVSEDITGAIAQAVNFTIDELRALVMGITTASDQLMHATGKTAGISNGLLAAAERQSQEISGAGEAVQLITQSIQEVDGSATQSAKVAKRTLEVTALGAVSVKNSIEGMDSVRGQMQETSRRIRRLGESSQEIGEIVDLISDITEQTNVLALNAAIQAASAGDAGRGFSVVAEEVQRLAERSTEATKQIGALVKRIQSDTQDAVAAMEKSAQGVVNGARLSDIASQSLKEIESVSEELANLISSISVSTQVQTDIAREVARSMTEILNITKKTTADTKLTNASVAELANLASELKGSVSGFKV